MAHVTIAGVWLDVSIEEGYDLQADITDSPVESGADITTHVRVRPEEVTIKGIISNHPIEEPQSHLDGARVDPTAMEIEGEPALLELPILGVVPGLQQVEAIAGAFGGSIASKRILPLSGLRFTGQFDRVQMVKDALRAAIHAAQTVQVITGMHSYPAMLLSGLHIERSADTGDALHFTVTATAARIVNSETGVEVPDPVHERSKSKRNAGKVNAQAVTDAASLPRRSGLAKLAGL